MKTLLSDETGPYPVCKQGAPDDFFGSYGTVAAIVMEPAKQRLH